MTVAARSVLPPDNPVFTANPPSMDVIARIHNAYTDKFGIPRQTGLVDELTSQIVFEPAYRSADAIRGIEDFDYLWLIWQFSKNLPSRQDNAPLAAHLTVRPPRLGGNLRLGVFATRSPFRPNALGLSSVRLLKVEYGTDESPILYVAGADLMDNTPILDIKPYIPYADSHPDAKGGFAGQAPHPTLQVLCNNKILHAITDVQLQNSLMHLLSLDPRPPYQRDPHRIYGFLFGGHTVRFRVNDEAKELTILEIR